MDAFNRFTRSSLRARLASASAQRRFSPGVSGVKRGHGWGFRSGPRWTNVRYAVHACRISPDQGTSVRTLTPTSSDDLPTWLSAALNVTTSWVEIGA